MPTNAFLYSLPQVLANPTAAVNDTQIDGLLDYLAAKPTQPLSALMRAVYPETEVDLWTQWDTLGKELETLAPELKNQLETVHTNEQAEAARRERAAFLAGYFFRQNPIALLGCLKK